MATIAIANQKGGVGKTTTAVNLSVALAMRGFRTLLLDADPQMNSTGSFIDPEQVGAHFGSLFSDPNIKTQDAILSTQVEHLDLLPSHRDAAGLEQQSGLDLLMELQIRLKDLNYDFIVIDCPPSNGNIVGMALIASDFLLIPVSADFYAMDGIAEMLRTFSKAQKFNPRLRVLGYLITQVDRRTKLSEYIINSILASFGELVFETMIPQNVRLKEAPGYRESIFQFAPGTPGAVAYEKFACEVIDRVQKDQGLTPEDNKTAAGPGTRGADQASGWGET